MGWLGASTTAGVKVSHGWRIDPWMRGFERMIRYRCLSGDPRQFERLPMWSASKLPLCRRRKAKGGALGSARPTRRSKLASLG